MAEDRIIQDGNSVTVVVSRNVFPGHERDYDEWVRRMMEAAKETPGNQAVTLLMPPPGRPGLNHLVIHFKDEKSMHIWETSYLRQKLSHEADAFSRRIRQEATGLETWFSIPECPELETPPRWKMSIVTFIAVYVLSIIMIPLLDVVFLGESSYFKGRDFYLMTILVAALLVLILTYAVMPWFSRYIFLKWLYK